MDKNEVREDALNAGFGVAGFRNNEFKLTRFAAEVERRTIERCSHIADESGAHLVADAIRELGENNG